MNLEGKKYLSKRLSCRLLNLKKTKNNNPRNRSNETSNSSNLALSYDKVPAYDWSSSRCIERIREEIEAKFNDKYDYCLIHLYRDGKDRILWHNDKEAIDSSVVSISFGATRKFQIRDINNTKGCDYEYLLQDRDIFLMKPTMQSLFKHGVPVEARIKFPRINLTFRKFKILLSLPLSILNNNAELKRKYEFNNLEKDNKRKFIRIQEEEEEEK